MATLSIKADDAQVRGLLSRIAARLGDLTPVMREIGEIVRESVMRNFAESRAPDGSAWKPSRRALAEGGKTLVKRAILRNSINVRATCDQVLVGTPVAYGPTHQFGAARGSFGAIAVTVKAHLRRSRKGGTHKVRQHRRNQKLPWGNILARPFLGVRSDDWTEIRNSLLDYLASGA